MWRNHHCKLSLLGRAEDRSAPRALAALLYLPEPVYEALREAAFKECCKIHGTQEAMISWQEGADERSSGHADAGVGDGELDEVAAIAHLACRMRQPGQRNLIRTYRPLRKRSRTIATS